MWKGIIGKAFTKPLDFQTYVENTRFNLWRPKFTVVHNTSAPDLKLYAKWVARGNPSDEQWMRNLEGFYRDTQHWSAGPHIFVTPRGICVFTPLTTTGVHSPSWNSISWGVETVGEFEREPFYGAIHDNLVAALGILHSASGLSPLPYRLGVTGLHFHKEDVRTTHRTCPGRNMVKEKLIADVQNFMRNLNPGDHNPGASGSV